MKKQTLLSFALTASLTTANAHDLWIVPSQTQLSGAHAWVTFDASASNQIFVSNHAPLDLVKMQAWSPNNKEIEMQNAIEGKIRTVFDLQLQEPGTYQVLRGGVSIFARGKRPENDKPKGEKPQNNKSQGEKPQGDKPKEEKNHGKPSENGKPELGKGDKPGKSPMRRGWRGTPSDYLKGKYPKQFSADNFVTSVSQVETFVTLGAPTDTVTAPSNYGLDIDYLTHPNDLVVGEVVKFRVVIDSKPAPNIEVEIIEGGSQYRNNVNPLKFTSNDNGEISVIWQRPGMYWLHANSQDDKGLTTNKKRRLSYSAVLEVLPD